MKRVLLAAVAAVTIAGPVAAEDTTIAGVVFQQDQFFRQIQMGMEAAAEAAGATMLSGSSDSRPEKEISLIDTYIARGVDAIVISPISETASVPALRRAKDAGIQVVTYNTNVAEDIPVAYLTSNHSDLGESTGKMASAYIQEHMGGSAKIGTLAFQALLPEQSGQRVNGFLEEVQKENDIEIVSQQDGWLAEEAVRVAGDMITANPDIDIIYAANEGGTVGAVQAVRNAGKQGEIVVFGIDGTLQIMSFLESDDNVLQATTAQQPFVMGEMAVNSALAAMTGEDVEKNVTVPVLGLSRTDPDGMAAFRADLEALQ